MGISYYLDSNDWSDPRTYFKKALFYKKNNHFNKSIRSFYKSEIHCKAQSQDRLKEISLLNIGAIYEGDLGDAKSAEQFYKKALAITGVKYLHSSSTFQSVSLNPYLYKLNSSFGSHEFVPSYIYGDYSAHYIYQHIPKMGGRFVVDPIDIALREATHYTLKSEGLLHYLYWRRIQSQAPLIALIEHLKELDKSDIHGSLFIPHNINHRPLSIALSKLLSIQSTTISVIRTPESRLLSNIKFCLTNDGNDPKLNYPIVKKEILDNHEMYDNPLFHAFYFDLDEIDSNYYADTNLVCSLDDMNRIKFFQSQMLSGLKLPNIMIPKVIHQTKFDTSVDNEAMLDELYHLSIGMGHIEKDKIAFNALTNQFKSYELSEGLIHPLTLCFNEELQAPRLVRTESLFP